MFLFVFMLVLAFVLVIMFVLMLMFACLNFSFYLNLLLQVFATINSTAQFNQRVLAPGQLSHKGKAVSKRQNGNRSAPAGKTQPAGF